MFDAAQFCEDYNIEYWTEGSKNVSKGWINIQCPFCGDVSNHLGIELETGKCNCWKCGGKKLSDIVWHFTKDRNKQDIIDKYSWLFAQPTIKSIIKKKLNVPGTRPLTIKYKEYLERRGFDPDYIEQKYDLRYGEPYSKYEYRLIIPIYFQHEIVSFQTRRVFDDNSIRYKNCSNDTSIIENKKVCYNIDNCKMNKAIALEGVTDVWRIGDNSFATFGTSFTEEQLILIHKKFDRIYWLYDPGQESLKKAKQAAYKLSATGLDIEIIQVEGINDPGSMSESDVIHLIKELRMF